MIFIDPRAGSGELRPLFSSFAIPIVDNELLECADFMFLGRCVDKQGNPEEVAIGVERKALLDLLACLDDARFVGEQMPKMLASYRFSFLFIEGIWRADAEGFVEVMKPINKDQTLYKWQRLHRGTKPVFFGDVSNHLSTLRMKTGLEVVETADKMATAWTIAYLYKWFNDKSWDEHRSHLRTYDPASVLRMSSSVMRRVAMQLSGIGHDKSLVVERSFPSIHAMCEATEKEWMKVDGIGKIGAKKIVRELNGGQA